MNNLHGLQHAEVIASKQHRNTVKGNIFYPHVCVHKNEEDGNVPGMQETPSPFSYLEFREAITSAAVRLGQHAKYRSAGTVEFLVDDDTGKFYFLEARSNACNLVPSYLSKAMQSAAQP